MRMLIQDMHKYKKQLLIVKELFFLLGQGPVENSGAMINK